MTAVAKVAAGAACVTEMMTIARSTGPRLIMILTGVLALQIIFTTVQRLFFWGQGVSSVFDKSFNFAHGNERRKS